MYSITDTSGQRTSGLRVVPISADLRYCIPPKDPGSLRRFQQIVRLLSNEPEGTLLVYADDLERTAGVGGWESDQGGYEAFLRWLVEHPGDQVAVRLDAWLEGQSPEERRVETGTFYELAQLWKAGEDYRGWSEAAAWRPYREYLAVATDAVLAATRQGGDERLLSLAWKHLLASAHETAWQDPIEGDHSRRAPAPWAKAVASHARACLPMAAAAKWVSEVEPRTMAIELTDIDLDGEQEVVLCGGDLFVVVTPKSGGRLVALFQRRAEGGVLCIGNPTDHWNFQEHLNRCMDSPPNHPGALADVGYEHDTYRVTTLRVNDGHAQVWLRNAEVNSALRGARKGLLLYGDAPALLVCYQLPDVTHLATQVCLSPDYYGLMRTGRRYLWQTAGETWRGVAHRTTRAWVALSPDEKTAWGYPVRPEIGHGINVRIEAHSRHFHLLIGCGDPDDERSQALMADGRRVLCGTAPAERRELLAADLVTSARSSP
ncbi:MAG: hypothetical protein ACRDTT_00440 [Pseudonocardiaceae bacterium]